MKTSEAGPKDIDEFIAGYPPDVQAILQQVRLTIREAAPQAKETKNYGIPTFTLEGNLVHFSTHKNHIGFYPTPGGIEAFKDELSAYELSKGTVKFPLCKPIPYDLIRRIVALRVQQNLEKAEAKRRKK